LDTISSVVKGSAASCCGNFIDSGEFLD